LAEGVKNKGGRPPKYAGEGKRVTHTMRVRAATREKLKAAAAESGRSMSEEIEYRVEKSFWEEDLVTRLLAVLAEQAPRFATDLDAPPPWTPWTESVMQAVARRTV
jgi:uncharacterized protein (DUF1778 family)